MSIEDTTQQDERDPNEVDFEDQRSYESFIETGKLPPLPPKLDDEISDDKDQPNDVDEPEGDDESDDQGDEKTQDDTEETEDDDESESDDESEDDEKPEDKKELRNRTRRDRIKRLARKLDAREDEIETLKREVAELKRVKAEDDLGEEPNPEDYESQVEWAKDYYDWRDKKKDLESKKTAQTKDQSDDQVSEVEQKRNAATLEYHDRVEKYKKDRPDFEKKVVAAVKEVKPSLAIYDQIVYAEDGPELMYALAEDIDEFERINEMSYDKSLVALGEFRAKLRTRKKIEAKTGNKRVTTRAPKPPSTPRGAGGKDSVGKDIYDAENMTQREWEAHMERLERGAG